MSTLQVRVVGTPAPQGSHRGFVVNGRAVITQDNKKTKPWRQDVKAAVLDAITAYGDAPEWTPLAGPLRVHIVFWMPRPAYHYGTGRNANTLKSSAPNHVDKKPDIDKLARATLDALTEAGVWRDDSQVAALDVTKRYATGNSPGAQIHVTPLTTAAAPAAPLPADPPHGAAAVPTTVQEALL